MLTRKYYSVFRQHILMRRILHSASTNFSKEKMANLPPRKNSSASKSSKQDLSPLQILLQMGFPKHRALKALAATGHRSVQLASDWLLTHVNDTFLDTDEPREYILYAHPTGPLMTQLLEFWDKSKEIGGWNGAHNFPPHITLVSFFKAPDEASLQVAKALKYVVETVGPPPDAPLKLEPYQSHNFMGLFVSEEHADYLKKIAVQYVKQVSSALGVTLDTYEHLDALGTCFPWCTMPQQKPIKSVCLEPHVKSLHITLAYHFEVTAYDALKQLVDELRPLEHTSWELRLYSRDPRFANHQVYKVSQGHSPQAHDELELVLGDYVYMEEGELATSPDGWVHGTSWLTGVSGHLPAVYTRRTPESDAWTLHKAISLRNHSDTKSETDSTTDGEMTSSEERALGHEKSEECYKEWHKYWQHVKMEPNQSILKVTQGSSIDWKADGESGDNENTDESSRRWVFAMRHGERVDITYGQWTSHCFDAAGRYVRKDLNMPIALAERRGGAEAYSRDTPLTRVGRLQARLVGEALRLARVPVTHVYASSALRCVETAHEFLLGLEADKSIKIKVEPGLFEYKFWHLAKGLGPHMTLDELQKAGLNVDMNYKPFINLEETSETLDEFYERNEKVMQTVVQETEAEGGNVIFVGHASTLDLTVHALTRLSASSESAQWAGYQINKNLLRVPYCALAALRGAPWTYRAPPVPPHINSSSGRFDWKILADIPPQ